MLEFIVTQDKEEASNSVEPNQGPLTLKLGQKLSNRGDH